MDIFNEEIIKFWTALKNHEVQYIMVGGFAANLHGFQRATGDMDILLEDSLGNRKKLRAAFAEYGMGDIEPLERIQFVPGWTNFYLNNGFQIDLMVAPMKGLESFSFTECYQLASVAEIYNLKIPFLHINQLIQNKKAVNRPKDQVDVIELEKIKKILDSNNENR